MKKICIDDNWVFRRGFVDSLGMLDDVPGERVNLPHDGMIGTAVRPDAPARADSGYFVGGLTNYTKYIMIPKEWENECIGLSFDGAMMNVTIDVNGSKVGSQHYGYAPFYVDLTDHLTFGEENRITVNCNTSMHVNSRWYTGSGLYRGVALCHGPRLHLMQDGIFIHTKEVSDGYAFLEALVEVENSTLENRLAEIIVSIGKDGSEKIEYKTRRVIEIKHGKSETARLDINLKDPLLWDAEHPNLYKVKAEIRNLGVYRTHLVAEETNEKDEAETLFGVRMITSDPIRGLRINGKTVKLKGGCLHHDNGLLGAVSLYEAEARKLRKLKEAGFNAIRTAHNPPSAALIEACDRVGVYVFDEAFDAWGMAKRGGDYSQFFASDWEKDLRAFVRRDRNHPAVIIWSIGNEIPERGGLGGGYTIASQLADAVRKLDGSRPVSNGICSFWSGLDDELTRGQIQKQNTMDDIDELRWEKMTEPFTNGLDIVGYNYMEDLYEHDHEIFPERVMLGTETFPKEMGFRWPYVEKLPYAIGDFTWTAWDYIGEAGIGKAAYVEADDPMVKSGGWDLMPQDGSPFPWRLANDADFDITGNMRSQGAYRNVVFGSKKTYLFSMHPSTFGKTELMTLWGFPEYLSNWNYEGYENKPVRLVVFSRAEEAEVFVNGKSIGRKAVATERPMPNAVYFDTVYTPGMVEAVSYRGGKVVSRDILQTAGEAAAIRLIAEKNEIHADGHDLLYVGIEIVDKDGDLLTDARVELKALITQEAGGTDCASLAGFGSADPVTEDDYTDAETRTFRGRAMAIIRAGYSKGKVKLEISADGLPAVYEEFNLI